MLLRVSEWVNGMKVVVSFLPEARSLFSTNTTETFLSLLFLCTAFFYWVNTGTQQAIFQNNIRVMLLTSSFPTMYNVHGKAVRSYAAWLEILIQTAGVTGAEDLWQSNLIMSVRVFPQAKVRWNIFDIITILHINTKHYIETFFTLNSFLSVANILNAFVLFEMWKTKAFFFLAVLTNWKHHWSCTKYVNHNVNHMHI